MQEGHLFRKGNQTDFVKKKVERFKLNLLIKCKKHGEHLKWRLHSDNNVQCLFCASEWQMNQRRRNPLRFIYRDAKKHAHSRNRKFEITLENLSEIINRQKNRCSLTGIEFNYDNPPSLDRKDSEKGYTLDNIQLVHIKINRMKSDMIENEFIELCQKIVAYSEARRGKKKKKAK